MKLSVEIECVDKKKEKSDSNRNSWESYDESGEAV